MLKAFGIVGKKNSIRMDKNHRTKVIRRLCIPTWSNFGFYFSWLHFVESMDVQQQAITMYDDHWLYHRQMFRQIVLIYLMHRIPIMSS